MHKHLLLVAAASVVAGLAVREAWSGEKLSAPVVVVTANKTAWGSMGAARNSADSNQSIGCYVYGYETGVNRGTCVARTSASVMGVCHFYNKPQFERLLATISDDSRLEFSWDANSSCTQLRVDNFSYYEPKQ